MDCFAEPVLGLAEGKTRVLAMTMEPSEAIATEPPAGH
jgi:hypothetical protein